MAKAAYVGISNKARRITDMYVGINNVARKIKKAYVGVSGVARLFFKHMNNGKSDFTLTLSQARADLQAGSIDQYIIFAGGNNYGYERYPTSNNHVHYNTVDAFDKNLVRTTPLTLSERKANFASANNSRYAMFAGGEMTSSGSSASGTPTKTVDGIKKDLTKFSSNLGYNAYNAGGATINDYCIFAGGQDSSMHKHVYAFSNTMARTTCTDLTLGSTLISGASVGDYAIFGGGYGSGTNRTFVNAYNSSLVQSTASDFYRATSRRASANVGNYAIFVGGFQGYTANNGKKFVDAYSTNLTHTYLTNLPEDICLNAGSQINSSRAIFGGGKIEGSTTLASTVYTFNSSLVRTSVTSLNAARDALASSNNNGYILFGGGGLPGNQGTRSMTNLVDVYEYYT